MATAPSLSPNSAAELLVAGLQELAHAGQNPVTAILAGHSPVTEAHYPPGDVVDASHGFRYYYHCHDEPAWQRREHGHFHLFRESQDRFHHLLAISADARGFPVRAFTTNRWVTGEDWCNAAIVRSDLQAFTLPHEGPFGAVNRVLRGLVGLFAETLMDLIAARDQRVHQLRAGGRSAERVLEDRRIHILSQTPLNLLEQLDAVT